MSRAATKIQLGVKLTNGLGAGANPEIGRKGALEDSDKLIEAMEGADMVFVTAGLGGGTGTGAAPIIASLASEMGALTVAVVTKPFAFEGKRRLSQAERGLAELIDSVDTMIVIPNEKLLAVAQEAGAIDGARGILINITGSSSLKLAEVNEASTIIQSAAHEDANIIFGAVLDEKMKDEVKITVIATGFKTDQPQRKERTVSSAHAALSSARTVSAYQGTSQAASPQRGNVNGNGYAVAMARNAPPTREKPTIES